MSPRSRYLSILLGLMVVLPAFAVAMPLEASFEPPALPQRAVVGYRGEPPVTLAEANGATVIRIDPDLEFMVVETPDLAAFSKATAALPNVEYVELDARVREYGASWDGSNWDGSNWDGSNWDGSNWDGSNWDGSNWDGSNWDGSNWDGSNWDGSAWDGAQWDGSNWDGARWDGSSDDGSSPSPARMDPGYPLQWGHGAVRLPGAWETTLGSGEPIVCVVDSGVDYTHPDLAASMWTGPAGNHGYNVIARNDDPMDDGGHGTHVAGIIAATIGNGVGIAGVAKAKIMAVKVLGADGSGYESDLATGIGWCASNGADIVSMSLGTEVDAKAVSRAVTQATNAGLILVASAGNGGCECLRYPAAYPGVLGVGAIDANMVRTGFSNTGDHVDLVAPGYRIVSTFPGGKYVVGSGTSQAAPYVAGVAALLLGSGSHVSTASVRAALLAGARDAGDPGRDDEYGHGILDAEAALALVGGSR